jgi:hypothetical protein
MGSGSIRRQVLWPTISALLVLAACDSGDEYNEDGRLIEKTNVRVAGVDIGRLVDSTTQSTDGADEFLPSDTVFAAVRTRGASPQTVLGVRWLDSTGSEVNGGNTVIRPTGDTSTLFSFHHMTPMATGQYTLQVRVNGGVVKTKKLVVRSDAEPRSLAPKTVTRGIQPRFAGVKSLFASAVSRAGEVVESLRDRGNSGNQSAFEWRGLRGGMSFAKLDRISNPGTPWKCTPMILNAVGLERSIALESGKFSAGQLKAIVDARARRVVDIGYSTSSMKPDDPQRVELESEMSKLATKWDNMPGVIRRPTSPRHGPHFAEWVTPDTSWKASIFYYGDLQGVDRPTGFEIEQLGWGERMTAEVPDSIKGQLRNPASDYYRHPNAVCDALLKSR